MAQSSDLDQVLASVIGAMSVSPADAERRKAYLDLGSRDADILRSVRTALAEVHDELMEEFYDHLLAFPETRSLLSDPALIERLKRKQWSYLAALTSGRYDWNYIQERLRVGVMHQRIGLEPRWYIGAYSQYLCSLVRRLPELLDQDAARVAEVIVSLLKVVFLDLGLVLETYFQTDRQANMALRQLADSIVCNTPSGLIVLSEDLSILAVNRFVERLVDDSHASLRGRSLESVFPGLQLGELAREVLSGARDRVRHCVQLSGTDSGHRLEVSIQPMEVPPSADPLAGRAHLLLVLEDITERERLRDASREAGTRMQAVLQSIQEGIVMLGPQGRIESVNAAAGHIFGRPSADLIGEPFAQFLAPADRRVFREYLDHPRSRTPGNGGALETRLLRTDGPAIPVELSLSEIRLGRVRRWVAVLRDTSERKRAEAEREKLSRALEQTADSIVITNARGIIEYVNAGFEQITGWSREEAIGRTPAMMKSEMQDAELYRRLWETIRRGDVFRGVIINRRKDGSLYYEEKTITPLRDELGVITHYISSGKDITERMQAQERLQYLANHDVLTALPNRLLFTDRLMQAIASSRRHGHELAVLFMDLDRFKVINDSQGHHVGDLLLKQVAARLSGALRKEDTVARLSGDEFAIITPAIGGPKDAALLAEKLLERVSRPFSIDGRQFRVTCSIGVAMFPEDGSDAQALLKHADTAMYSAKAKGKNTYRFYTPAMNVAAEERFALEHELRLALDGDEFELHYQPQVSLRDRRIMGVKALIRWRHPRRGLVSPAEFVPMLEETGLILAVGDWVVERALEDLCRWRRAGLTVPRVAINVAPRQLLDTQFPLRVTQRLAERGLRSSDLEIEITESSLIDQDEAVLGILHALAKEGVSIAMDDFGTGYSSLSYLRQFPIRTIKIDRTFIRDVPADPGDCGLTRTIIALGHNLNLQVIAEGVENPDQLAFLSEQSCDGIQGFHIARPMPPAEFGRFLGGLGTED